MINHYGKEYEEEFISVPSLVGLDAYTASITAINSGFNIKIQGIVQSAPSAKYRVVSQSLPYGANVERGSVIKITVMKIDFED